MNMNVTENVFTLVKMHSGSSSLTQKWSTLEAGGKTQRELEIAKTKKVRKSKIMPKVWICNTEGLLKRVRHIASYSRNMGAA